MTLEDTTFTDVNANRMDKDKEMSQEDHNLGSVLARVVCEAWSSGRMTCGMFDATQQMEIDPDDILVCLLPVSQINDTQSHIQHVLLEAFCFENGIRCLKVDCALKLTSIVSSVGASRQNPMDLSCVVLHQNWNSSTTDELLLIEKYKELVDDGLELNVVELPAT